jgi:hypothetical protein
MAPMQSKKGPGYVGRAKRRIARLYRGSLSSLVESIHPKPPAVPDPPPAPPEPTVSERLARIQDRLNACGDDDAAADLRREYRSLLEEEPAKSEVYDFALRNEAFLGADGFGIVDTLLDGLRRNVGLSPSACSTLLTRLLSASRLEEGAVALSQSFARRSRQQGTIRACWLRCAPTSRPAATGSGRIRWS